jgi:hypothetical protein
MPTTSIKSRKPALAVLLTLILASLGLAACGGSSSSSSTGTTAKTATSASAQTGGRNSGRFAALRACLQKNGITLPQRTPGAGRRPGAGGPGGAGGAGGGFFGGGAGAQLPKGVTRAQLQTAMAKCGGSGAFGRGGRANNPAFRQSLAKFAACMRQNGVNLPAPSTSGGPVFSTKGLNTRSKAFMAADTKCQSLLRGSFRGGGGASGSANGAPGAGGPPGPGGTTTGAGAPPASGAPQSQ